MKKPAKKPRSRFLPPLAGFALFLALCSAGLPARAAPAIPAGTPIRLQALTLVYDLDENTAVFQGDVEAQQADFWLWSSTLTLYLRPGDANPPAAGAGDAPAALDPGSLDRIVAEENVRFRYRTQNGTAGKATYNVDSGLLVLEGNPVLREGENSITGNVIRYYLNENRSVVDGGPQGRVEAIFTSGGAKTP
jgi:lipopolysaccharide export system protein LptA